MRFMALQAKNDPRKFWMFLVPALIFFIYYYM
jgi:hypothetical protein